MSTFAQTDSLTISDTIGTSRQRAFLQTVTGYNYYGASQLTGNQLLPVLNRSPNLLTRKLTGQSHRLNWISTGLVVGGLGLIIDSYAMAGRRYGQNSGLLLTGDLVFLSGLIPQSMSARRLDRAIAAHNVFLRQQADDYLPPVVYTTASRQWPLSLADTIARKRVLFTSQYTYRGIRVYPNSQLNRLTASLNDREVKAGVRYVRTVSTISGIVGATGRFLLTTYLGSVLLNRRYRRVASTSDDLLTTSLICLGANFVLSYHANRAQRRWVDRYNDRLKQPFPLNQ